MHEAKGQMAGQVETVKGSQVQDQIIGCDRVLLWLGIGINATRDNPSFANYFT